MAMENQELLEALRYIIKEETRAVVKKKFSLLTAGWTTWTADWIT
ncbi:MAG: hypothetical protein ACLR13_04415 [Acutalibacteraceae bacterium]